jgi:hypothetical protein
MLHNDHAVYRAALVAVQDGRCRNQHHTQIGFDEASGSAALTNIFTPWEIDRQAIAREKVHPQPSIGRAAP